MSPIRRLIYFLFHGTPVTVVPHTKHSYRIKFSNVTLQRNAAFSNTTIIKKI